jgi:hypothetical protein
MKLLVAILFTILSNAHPAEARDDRLSFEIKKVVNSFDGREKIAKDIQLFWGTQSHPPAYTEMSGVKTNLKTNAFNKTDEEACSWVLLSAIIALQNETRNAGGDGIVDIVSNYKNQPFDSKNQFECGAGTIIAGVALKGKSVKFKGRGKAGEQATEMTKGSLEENSDNESKCKKKNGSWIKGQCVISLDD